MPCCLDRDILRDAWLTTGFFATLQDAPGYGDILAGVGGGLFGREQQRIIVVGISIQDFSFQQVRATLAWRAINDGV